MILLVTNRTDITTDHVVAELRRRGVPFYRLNTETLSTARINWHSTAQQAGWTISVGGRALDLARVRGAYLRRSRLPDLPTVVREGERAYALGEWSALLEAVYAELDGRWLNPPAAMARAENKLGQLTRAGGLGFRTPATLVTNDPADFEAFAAASQIIVKPLRNGSITEPNHVSHIFTSRLVGRPGTGDEEAIKVAPFIAQHEIEKTSDIRVTIVGDKCFAAEIASQEVPETETDWRRGDVTRLQHRVHRLPDETRTRCIELVRAFGLRFGAVDLILDRDGAYWFLEINPNGQWAWVETMTGQPISAAIVDELLRISGA